MFNDTARKNLDGVSERSKVRLLPSFSPFYSVQRNVFSILEEISGGNIHWVWFDILYIIKDAHSQGCFSYEAIISAFVYFCLCEVNFLLAIFASLGPLFIVLFLERSQVMAHGI